MDNKRSQTLSPRSMRRSSDCSSRSPEFEFWMVRNPSFPQPNILSADELFVDGVILPLHLLPTQEKPDPPTKTPQAGPEMDTQAPEPDPEKPGSSPAITDSATASTPSKRWKDIFRKSEKKNSEENEKDKEKAKKKEKKSGTGGGGTSSAELNINIWPFSRSRSAGNTGTRPKLFPGAPTTRKVNSAPCSRSNSAGESKSRKWPSSPGRVGVHLGRSSPVWQVRRGGSTSKNSEPFSFNPDKSKRETHSSRRSKLAGGGSGSGSAKTRVLNLNVPMCIGYGHHLSCRSDDNRAIGVSGGSDIRGNNSGNVNVGSKLFNLRSERQRTILTGSNNDFDPDTFLPHIQEARNTVAMSEKSHRLYVKGKHISYQRGKRNTTPGTSLLKLEGVDNTEAAQFYAGKRVAYVYRAQRTVRGSKIRVIWGKVTRPHGNSGVVRAKFRSNLPPKTFGASVRVMLYPSSI